MILLLSSAKFVEVACDSVYILRVKPQHSVVVEAIDPFKWVLTSMSNILNVLCPYNVAAPLIGQACGSCLELCLHSGSNHS